MQIAHKKTFQTSIQQAHRLVDAGKIKDAQKIADALALQLITDSQLFFLLAEIYHRIGFLANAVQFYAKSLLIKPDNPIVMASLAMAHIAMGQYSEAEHLLSQALVINGNCVEAVIAKSHLLLATDHHQAAIEWLEKAVKLGGADATVFTNLPIALALSGRHLEALDYAEKGYRRFPKNPKILYALARIYNAVGRTQEAERLLIKAIQIQPSYGPAYQQLSASRKFTSQDTPLSRQAEAQLHENLPVEFKTDLLFALGKMYDDIGNFDNAFLYFQQGNQLLRQPEKPKNDADLVSCQKKLLSVASRTKDIYRNPSSTPIFIVGMPRSGTSLIEQIIASHPQAAGAGELTDIRQIAIALHALPKHKTLLGHTFSMPNKETWQQYSEKYLTVLCANREDASRITDKLPENYRFLGLINLLFPNARILHVIRHPLDTCLSCYFQSFVGLPWTNDLQWIAETYRDYRQTMDEWKKLLPAGKIVDINYEQLIAEPELQTKHLIEACALDWDPACLEYFTNNRSVQTASAWQVRQPIYQTSTMRWTKYAPHLHELANALSEFLQDDRELLEQHGIQLKHKGLFSR